MRQAICIAILSAISITVHSKTIDLRNKTDTDGGTREISFCARPSPDKPGLPGHAFVAFAQVDKNGGVMFRALGHTVFSVSDALLSYNELIPATGALVSEKYTSIKQECLTIQVNNAEYQSAYTQATQPLAALGVKFDESKPIQKTYALGINDCMDFMVTVANRFTQSGLKIPKREPTDLPLPYLRKFIDAN